MRALTPILVLTAALALPAAAQVTAEQTVLTETVTVDETGRETIQTKPAERVVPGDRLAYVLRYENEGAAPADGLVLVMPVPSTIAYVPGTEGGGAPEQSVDGGQTFGTLAALTVTEDGTPRPAEPTDVTHLRWRLAGSVAPGEAGEVSFRGVLR